MTESMHRTTKAEWGAYFLFWSWNAIFLAFMLLGFAPRLLPELVYSVRTGTIPFFYLIAGTVLSLVPVGVVALGATTLRKEPARLLGLGYVVEGPLMLLLALRFFLIRQATPAMTAILVIACLGMAAFLWHLLDRKPAPGQRWLGLARLCGLTLILLVSLYAAVWIAFYAVPLIYEFLKGLWNTITHLGNFFREVGSFFRNMFSQGWAWVPFTLLGFVLVLYTATLFVITPIAVPVLAIRAWWRRLAEQTRQQGWVIPVAGVVVTAALVTLAMLVTIRQPQKTAFHLLETPPASLGQARALLQQQGTIRAGLLNSYLAPFRYLSSVGEVDHVSNLYTSGLGLSKASAARVQALYEAVARPLLYDPVERMGAQGGQNSTAFSREPVKAAELYQRFFDQPITEGERGEIVAAVRSTWSADQAEAAWRAVDERSVHLERQEITVQEHGDWAEIELYEVYLNKTQMRQEVIYYFNLPESAVLTGVWLGNSPDRARRAAFQVAPRGAAQAVYRNETRINRDPALLEQIGPRQYRLRVYPVEPTHTTWNQDRTMRVSEQTLPLYMWMTYSTPAVDGAWPLPRLAFHRNVFWDGDTQRVINGKPARSENNWMADSLKPAAAITPAVHRFDFPGGQTVLAQPASAADLPALPANARLAVVIDRSKSMEAHAAQVSSVMAGLDRLQKGGASVDLYLTSSPYRGEEPAEVSFSRLNPEELVYFGGQNPSELIAQFETLRAGRSYDGILVISDGTAYELGPSTAAVAVPDAPVWMVHLGRDIPLGYDDKTLEAVQASGGGVSTSLEEALARLAVDLAKNSGGSSATMRDALDGYTWTVLPTSAVDASVPAAQESGFTALLARRLILAEMRASSGTISDVATLDRLQVLAKQYAIVTPYSSMIVLVNDAQLELLEKLSQLDDRYKREYEDLKNTTPATATPLVGVPEPGEWLLIALAALMLFYFVRKQRAPA